MFDNISEPVSKQTEFLLKTIASRLASREDCRQVAYRVTIDHNGVRMNPLIYVYPNRYKRTEQDKIDIVSFVHQYKMHNAKLSGFVFGTYEYQLSANEKRRRWVKIEGN